MISLKIMRLSTTMIFVMLIIAGCASTSSWSHFKLSDDKQSPTPGSIAVISGSNSEFDVKTAELVTEEINAKTSFKAMSQDKITQIIPQYPAPLIDFKCSDTERSTTPFISDNTWAVLNEIQSRLKTRYIFLVWNENPGLISSQYGNRVRTTVFTRFIEYPQKNIVGYSFFSSHKGLGPFIIGNNVENGFSQLLKGNAVSVVKAMNDSLVSQKK